MNAQTNQSNWKTAQIGRRALADFKLTYDMVTTKVGLYPHQHHRFECRWMRTAKAIRGRGWPFQHTALQQLDAYIQSKKLRTAHPCVKVNLEGVADPSIMLKNLKLLEGNLGICKDFSGHQRPDKNILVSKNYNTFRGWQNGSMSRSASLLRQRARVWVLVLTWQLTAVHRSFSWAFKPPAGLLRHQAYIWHTCLHADKTLLHVKDNTLLLNKYCLETIWVTGIERM